MLLRAGVEVVPPLLVMMQMLLMMMMLLQLPTASGQAFLRKPKDGDSCRTYEFYFNEAGSYDSLYNYFIRILGSRITVECPIGEVVNSDSFCVRPELSDRCLPKSMVTPDFVSQRCAEDPTAVFAEPTRCTNFYSCSLTTTGNVACPKGRYYDDINKTCTDFTLVKCGDREFDPQDLEPLCLSQPDRVLPMANSCNGFFDCSMTSDPEGRFSPYHSECRYPDLYDMNTGTCRPFKEVQCYNRPEYKFECNLSQFRCGRSSHCRSCYIDHADCTNLSDGDHPFPNQPYTPRFARCKQGRSLGSTTCPPVSAVEPRLFDPRRRECTSVAIIPRSLGGLAPEDDGGDE